MGQVPDLIENALKNRQLSENSINLYKRNLLKLNDNKPVKNFNFLRNKEGVIDKIKNLKPTTQRSYIISICSILRDNPKFKKIYDEYFILLKEFNNNLKVNTDKSETQEKNWITQIEVIDIHKKLKEEVLILLNKKRKIEKEGFNKLLNFMVLSLYTLISPRRNKDYSLMKISSNVENDNFNYLVIDKKNNMKFTLNKYKTDKKYHSINIDIPEPLKEVIILYLKYHPSKNELKKQEYDIPFLVDEKGRAMKISTEITKILNKIFNKKISSSMLRNIFLTDKYSGVIDELKKDTNAMSTSVNTALNNYIKKD
jgi:hypothetical protein